MKSIARLVTAVVAVMLTVAILSGQGAAHDGPLASALDHHR
jgi:hypothetical protein